MDQLHEGVSSSAVNGFQTLPFKVLPSGTCLGLWSFDICCSPGFNPLVTSHTQAGCNSPTLRRFKSRARTFILFGVSMLNIPCLPNITEVVQQLALAQKRVDSTLQTHFLHTVSVPIKMVPPAKVIIDDLANFQ